ncbi:hypothetical protein AALB53_19835 [Lachnospiraceae bacterium 47-T17]
MDKDSVLYQLMDMRVNGVLDRILEKDEEYRDTLDAPLPSASSTIVKVPVPVYFPAGFPFCPSHSTYSAQPLVTYLNRGSMQAFFRASVEA